MFLGALLGTVALTGWPWWALHLPPPLRAHRLAYGALLALGFVAGELPNSFIKRQLDVAPGARRGGALGLALSLFDQADFVPAVWVTLAPLWRMRPVQAFVAFVVVAVGHLALGGVGYALGARRTWL